MKKAIKTVLSFALMLAMLVPTTASVFLQLQVLRTPQTII